MRWDFLKKKSWEYGVEKKKKKKTVTNVNKSYIVNTRETLWRTKNPFVLIGLIKIANEKTRCESNSIYTDLGAGVDIALNAVS